MTTERALTLAAAVIGALVAATIGAAVAVHHFWIPRRYRTAGR